ncbi:hypothetical protein F5972_08720 [Microbispora cellulosiformans]|uniref:Uncharacterized protein n=1 Tax=Microbispora cellulosiformans TaxID=2614688 RepID=A0A5J5K8H7_9ACTN|nr:hypothetical protein [Microbispora cellulosiformans]KAA9379723.1 hypothetical protein F5972_08720 [Microbispora cellulosiformans]
MNARARQQAGLWARRGLSLTLAVAVAAAVVAAATVAAAAVVCGGLAVAAAALAWMRLRPAEGHQLWHHATRPTGPAPDEDPGDPPHMTLEV